MPTIQSTTDRRTCPAAAGVSEGGLTIERRFTQAGVDPFDTVDWELRSAEVGSFKQDGVEFPATWSQNATNIVAQKYFRGKIGSPERESSVKQMIGRVSGTIADWGRDGGYFATAADADAFQDEHTHILLHQMAAFNSPVWFNVGFEESPQASACFILSVEDTIKSGGKTRRAAKMVVLDVDHPDIESFIWCKAHEEEKAAALRDAGFDMSIDGDGFTSIQYQNANNSVRVTDDFMKAAEKGQDWDLVARSERDENGELKVMKQVDARDLLRQISDAAWRCADPGVQYDTTINDWHTCPVSGRINASNPCCFTGDTLVQTVHGPIRFDELFARCDAGEELPFVHAFGAGSPAMAEIDRVWVAGRTDRLVEVRTDDGTTLRCTPEHRFLMADGTYKEAASLRVGAQLRAIAPAPVAVDSGGKNEPSPSVDAESAEVAVTDVEEVRLETPTRVFDLEVPGFQNFTVTSPDGSFGRGVVVHNSEYMHVDDSACNLASINLLKFRQADGSFDVAGFEHVVDVMILAQEIVVSPSSYPTEQIGRNARDFRQLGLGYANLGALLMADGLPYDSDEGRAACGAITALMTGRAYRKSAEVAAALGPYARFAENAEPHLHVMRKHQAAAYEISDSECPDGDLLAAARRAWDEAVAAGEEHGYRNAQATVLAPTGTISFLMDCDTTGIEPDFSLVKFKELVGGGQMTI